MMFGLKSVFLFGLVAISAATPTSTLERRAKIPDPLKCDGKEFSKQAIMDALNKAPDTAYDSRYYPFIFENKDSKGRNIFGAQGNLYEFPLLNTVWAPGTEPGTFRVIMKEDYSYVGVTNKDPGTGNTVHKC
ncbi:hypothetical protein M426DRAFT_269259 [Hypoxylon sp. CI-4A]|nr:hypothetical protein M426DRAFT_269259 [Hypoxylon sp. CI-4A]